MYPEPAKTDNLRISTEDSMSHHSPTNPVYAGRFGPRGKYLTKNASHLRLPSSGPYPSLPRLVTWGEGDLNLTYAAHVLARDLVRDDDLAEGFAQYLQHRFLNTLPFEHEWGVTRDDLLARLTHRESLTVQAQGRDVTLDFVVLPIPYGAELAIDVNGVLLSFPHPDNMNPTEPHAPKWTVIKGLGDGDHASDEALQVLADRHGFNVRRDERRRSHIDLRLDDGPREVLYALLDRAEAALRLDDLPRDPPMNSYTPGGEIPLHRAVEFGDHARAFLVRLERLIEGARNPERHFFGHFVDVGRLELAASSYVHELEQLRDQVLTDFRAARHSVVTMQMSPGWYLVGDDVLHLSVEGELRVQPLKDYVAWREKRPSGALLDQDWLNAPPEHQLRRLRNVEDLGPPRDDAFDPAWL